MINRKLLSPAAVRPARGRRGWRGVVAIAGMLLLGLSACGGNARTSDSPPTLSVPQPLTDFHLAANGNFDTNTFAPGELGFNLADISSKSELAAAPAPVRGMAWLNGCAGATAAFTASAGAYVNSRVFAFYLADDAAASNCPPAKLKSASDWIHQRLPGVKTLIILEDLCSSKAPCYSTPTSPALIPGNTDVDLFGLDAYPCRTDLHGCNDSIITKAVRTAMASGVPRSVLIPIFQAFGGNRAWADDSGGYYALPTARQEASLIQTWSKLLPKPAFDYAYSWGVQNGDVALADAPASLRQVFRRHNQAIVTSAHDPRR